MLPGELLLSGGVPWSRKREHREGRSLGIGVLQEREARPSLSPSKLGALPDRTPQSADLKCTTPKLGAISQPRNGHFRSSSIHAFTVKPDSFSALEGRGNFRFRELAEEGSWGLAGKYFEEKIF